MIRNCSSAMNFLWVTLLTFLISMDSQSECFKLVGPSAPLVTEAGKDLVLPCSIQPNTSAVDMRVEWFRTDVFNSLVHLYKDHEDRNEEQILSYIGRTALFREELQKGNTSLKLSAVQVSDTGAYKCLVEAKSWYDDITVNVIVVVLGHHPVITVGGYDDSGGISLVCDSWGWIPEPELLWLGREGDDLSAEATETHRDTEGFRVKRRITVYDSSRFYCRLLQKHHMMETDITISDEVFHAWKVAVASIAVLMVVSVVGLALTINCACQKKEIQRKRLEDELNRNIKYAVDVTLDPDTAHPNLILSDDGKEVEYQNRRQNLSNSSRRFDHCPCVLGKEGFSSGRFYYEVQVKRKTKWDLGVAKESINRKGLITVNPQNGFWAVVLRKGNEYGACTDAPVRLILREKPQTVGVFVDYEEGLVSFYDVEARSHIYSFTGQSFTEKLYPYFSPCNNYKGQNWAPLVISPVSK